MPFGTPNSPNAHVRALAQAWLFIGRKERRRKLAIAQLPKWAVGVPTAIGANVQSFNKQYRAVSAGVTGATPPSQLGGQASDGGILWQFIAA